MFGLFYKETGKRFSFAEYETKRDAKDAKGRLKKTVPFKLQVKELIAETKQRKDIWVLMHDDGGYACIKDNKAGFTPAVLRAKQFDSKEEAGQFFEHHYSNELTQNDLMLLNLETGEKQKFYAKDVFVLCNENGHYITWSKYDGGVDIIDVWAFCDLFNTEKDAIEYVNENGIWEHVGVLSLLNLRTKESEILRRSRPENCIAELKTGQFAYVWQWRSTGEFFNQTEEGGNYHCALFETAFLKSEDAANIYADSFASSFPRAKVRLVKIGVID